MEKNARTIFLHHSTGNCVWRGGVPEWIARYNEENGTSYSVVERAFPKKEPYGWQNYPYDYWNIWVKNGGDRAYMEEPTLEMLTADYEVIAFKHCFLKLIPKGADRFIDLKNPTTLGAPWNSYPFPLKNPVLTV